MASPLRSALLFFGVATALPTGTPAPNASACEVESCIVSPTDCASRSECQGCGDLCFGSDQQDAGYDLYLTHAGLSLQATAATVWDGSLAGGDDGPACSEPIENHCMRGSGDLTIATWPAGSAQAASKAACCAACTDTPGCKAWQLITKAGTTDPQCWAMSTAEAKSSSPDSCVSAIIPAGPAPLDGLLRSADVVLDWKNVQPQPPPAPYDWSALAGAVERAYANNGTLMMLLWAGAEWAPSWLYDLGIEKVATKNGGKSSVPNYLDPQYQSLLKAVHLDLARELRSLRPASKAFIALQPCVGSTGDDTPFHKDKYDEILDEDLSDRIFAAWPEFFQNVSLFLHQEAFAQEVEANEMVLLINAQGDSFPLDWVKENLPGSFIKLGQTGHEFQSNYERYRAAMYAPFLYSLQNGRPIRSRAELSGETCWVTGDICTPPRDQAWNFYAMSNFVATVHLDFWNVQPNAGKGILNDTDWAPMWRLLNRYSGVRWARQSQGAWIAFRDGLDAMDTDRFDVETYGPLFLKSGLQSAPDTYPEIKPDDRNKARAKAICTAVADRGCTLEDEAALLGGPMKQRRADGTNDVAFGDWRGDYGGFMRLIKPDSNTRGWWRQGSGDEKFGRFSRSFANPESEGALFPLSLDRGLWGGLPLSKEKQLAFRLLFLDRGTGVFTVHYDSLSGNKRLASVQKSDSGSWRELCATIHDGRFDGGGSQDADIWLRNTDTEDDVFGALEVADASVEDIALNGCDWQPATLWV